VEVTTTAERREALSKVEVALREADEQLLQGRIRDLVGLGELLGALHHLGVTSVLPPALSARLSPDNFASMLLEEAGVSALLGALAQARSATAGMLSTGLHDWWMDAEPNVIVISEKGSDSQQLFERFAVELERELSVARSYSVFLANPIATREHDELLPPVSCIVTNHPAYRDLGSSWGIQAIWWELAAAEFRVSVEAPDAERDRVETFPLEGVKEAASLVAEWFEEPVREDDSDGFGISVDELRAMESVLFVVREAAEPLALNPVDRVRLDVLIQTLQLQMRAPTPDRVIIKRVLGGFVTFAGGVLAGVVGSYFQGALVKFGVRWP